MESQEVTEEAIGDTGGRGATVTEARHGSPVSHHESLLVEVVRLEWLTDSPEVGKLLCLDGYIVYRGRVRGPEDCPASRSSSQAMLDNVMTRAIEGGTGVRCSSPPSSGSGFRRAIRTFGRTGHNRPALLTQTTSEHDAVAGLPDLPAYLTSIYSCQRPTPGSTPNDGFIEVLDRIRTIRKLSSDATGERAYSTAIASIAAYPYPITTARGRSLTGFPPSIDSWPCPKHLPELERLPGCGEKLARVYHEWATTGGYEDDESPRPRSEVKALDLFHNIWGVGATTAQKFYKMGKAYSLLLGTYLWSADPPCRFEGWSSLDDIVEHGWNDLSRVQQIGIKYYDEFLIPIPRAEVEQIGRTILHHARRVDPGFQMTIVGSYRRGKQQSGDVDVVVSHRDENATLDFVSKLVVSLEQSGHITHTLTLSLQNSQRGQRPVSWKADGGGGTGFDTLDKALVVWKDPRAGGPPSSTTLHRRVDIIISPWKTVGCAVLGWSGGTTFQRDLRWYCKNVKNLKFDSSGIRSRADGSWIDLESGKSGPAPDMVSAEKRVFGGVGLEWRRPEHRCTG